jgi:hypothetical protein
MMDKIRYEVTKEAIKVIFLHLKELNLKNSEVGIYRAIEEQLNIIKKYNKEEEKFF